LQSSPTHLYSGFDTAGAWVGWDGLPSVVPIGAVSALGVAAIRSVRGPPFVGEQQAGLECCGIGDLVDQLD
jgi:hypothetical protein